jgi:hypothetical protein
MTVATALHMGSGWSWGGRSPAAAWRQRASRSAWRLPIFSSDALSSVGYARAVGAGRTRAVHVALDPAEAERVRREWAEWRMPLPLEVVHAPFRSLEAPVLETVRAITARPGTIAAVVVLEIAGGSWWRDGLHNERSLYLEWLLRLEPRVVLSAAPLHRRL